MLPDACLVFAAMLAYCRHRQRYAASPLLCHAYARHCHISFVMLRHYFIYFAARVDADIFCCLFSYFLLLMILLIFAAIFRLIIFAMPFITA